MRILTTITCLLFISSLGFAQNFEPVQDEFYFKIEKTLKNLGTIERVYLSDKEAKTFEAQPGKEYWAGFAYKISNTTTRRMMLIELGPQGEKVGIKYPKYTKGIPDGENQIFGINFVAPNNDGKTIIYKVDANPESTVYIYKITRSAS
jgi:hypothetical protein